MQLLSDTKSFDGWIKRYKHRSVTTCCDMIFSIYLPPQAESQAVPILYWLSGLTCTDENFMQKAGAQRVAAELGLAIVCPDTSPRNTGIQGEDDNEDFGTGAGFYMNATQAPWNQHYNMYDYIVSELPQLIKNHFPVKNECGISGHSMGGHGALTIALKNPESYRSISALAPVCNPIDSPWRDRVFTPFLGDNKDIWEQYDATHLVANDKAKSSEKKLPIFIDQGEADEYLTERLKPAAFQKACEQANYPLTLRTHHGYGHSYYFVASFIEDHLRYHYQILNEETETAYY